MQMADLLGSQTPRSRQPSTLRGGNTRATNVHAGTTRASTVAKSVSSIHISSPSDSQRPASKHQATWRAGNAHAVAEAIQLEDVIILSPGPAANLQLPRDSMCPYLVVPNMHAEDAYMCSDVMSGQRALRIAAGAVSEGWTAAMKMGGVNSNVKKGGYYDDDGDRTVCGCAACTLVVFSCFDGVMHFGFCTVTFLVGSSLE